MMHAAPTAPSAPAMVAVTSPLELKADRLFCALRLATGMITPIRKYATPTHNKAFSGLASCAVPRPNNAPYAPHDTTAPATKTNQIIDRGLAFSETVVEWLMSGGILPEGVDATIMGANDDLPGGYGRRGGQGRAGVE